MSAAKGTFRIHVKSAQTEMLKSDDVNDHEHVDLESAQEAPAGPRSPVPPEQPSPPVTTPRVAPAPKQTSRFSHMQQKLKVIPSTRKGHLNTQFLATLSGVLKIAELVIGFVCFILAICSDRRYTSSAWTEHIAFETTTVVAVLILGYVVFPHLTLDDEKNRDGLLLVELVFYGINALFYFIAIWLMVHLSASWTADGRGAAVMCAILCVALTVIYAVETFTKFRAWRGEQTISVGATTHTRVTSPHPREPSHNTELSPESQI